MKKFLKVLFTLIIIIVLVGGITFLIDASRAASGKSPLCALGMGGSIAIDGYRSYYGLVSQIF